MEYEPNKVYDITHSRKGRMTVQVTAVNGEWVSVVIVAGIAKMLSISNDDLGPGEALTFRASLATIHGEVEVTA